jgi:GT2 family glycosyltransferase
VALLTARGDHLLSLLSTLETKAWFERIAQTVAGFELTKWYPPLRASRFERRRAFANGQFMLFDAHAYRTIGGHEAVREHLLEDMEFARRIQAYQLRASVLLADAMHRCRMYDDPAAFARGWKRIYTECANRRPSRLIRASWRLLVTATLLPLTSLLTLIAFPQFWPLGLAGILGYAAGVGTLLWSSHAPLVAGLCFPLGGILVSRILLQAACDLRKGVPIQWAGRSYIRQAR